MRLATFKHLSSKNSDYSAAEKYLLFEHDEFTNEPVLDDNGRMIPRENCSFTTLNCGDDNFAIACMSQICITAKTAVVVMSKVITT